jgi:hypothetical protein
MLRQLHVEGFRCFQKLDVAPLGRVNLLVGKNNSGKTALLDAIEVVATEQPESLLWGLWRRREASRLFSQDPQTGATTTHHLASVEHLFYGHQILPSASFSIQATNQSSRTIEAGISSRGSRGKEPLLWIERQDRQRVFFPLTADGALAYSPTASTRQGEAPILFLGTGVPDALYLSGLWDKIMLTDDETLAIEALRLIEPRVERLAFKGEGQDRNIVIKLRGDKLPVPIGSLGDGMRHLLALALHLAPCRGGCVLVDEIDTGLHHSMLGEMWRLVIETAKRLDIQVFATTHSLDCIRALAGVCKPLELVPEDLMMHRLEPDLGRTVAYEPADIASAIELEVEVR